MSLFLPSVAYLWIATVLKNFMLIKLFAQSMAPYVIRTVKYIPLACIISTRLASNPQRREPFN